MNEVAEKTGVDLTKADIIVTAGRGLGKPENLEMIAPVDPGPRRFF
jgi:electron transfer flavoprotein alpha subunit